MTTHAEYALRRPCISEILYALFAIPAPETAATEGLISSQNGKILDFRAAGRAGVGAGVADERSVAKKEKVRVGIE